MGFQHMYSLCRLSLFTSHNTDCSLEHGPDRTEGISKYRKDPIPKGPAEDIGSSLSGWIESLLKWINID